jgi:AcrR family transcriptional regulator
MSQELSRGERTRTEIVHAACRLFLQNGFHGTSMRQIAQEAGIAVSGIYNHFASKEDIFVAVVLKYHPVHSILPVMKSAQGETIEAFVRDGAARMVKEFGEHQEFLNLVFIELVEFKGSHLPRLFETIFPQVVGFVQQFIQGREELRPIPTAILVRAFIGLFFSYVMTDLMMGNPSRGDTQGEAFEQFTNIFLHGILKD